MAPGRAIIAALVLLSGSSLFPAQAADYICPDHVSATLTLMEPLEPGSPWTTQSSEASGAQTLSDLTLFDGPPEEKASLAPSAEGAEPSWSFPAPRPRQIWVACSYANTSLTLIQPLDDAITRCTETGPGTLSCQ